MSVLIGYALVGLVTVQTILVSVLIYITLVRQNQVKDKAVAFIKNIETAAEEAIDEGMEEAFGEDSEYDEVMQLSRDLLIAQNDANRLLLDIKHSLERKNVSIN